MKNRRKILKRIGLFVVIPLVVTILATSIIFHDALDYLLIRGLVTSAVHEFRKCQTRLLIKTDHQALLQACRKLSKQVAEGDLLPGRYGVRAGRHPKASQFPRTILNLAPIAVSIENDGRVFLEMYSGLEGGRLYAVAFPENYTLPYSFTEDHVKIIDGLWYYDDGLTGNPEHQKEIEELIQKAKGKTKKEG
jgi:hypothetical protein